MSGKTSPQGGLTRRSFLKTTGALAGAAAVAGAGGATLTAFAAGEPSASQEETYVGMCRGNCLGGCVFDITVREGKVAKVMPHKMPDARYTRGCLKGLSHPVRMYDDHRILYPLKRVEGTERGAGEWERISWDEAIDTIVSTWQDLRAKYGNETIAFYHVGANCAELTYSTPIRLEACMGATNFSGGADINFMQTTVQMFGTGKLWSGSEITNTADAQTVILWACNAAESTIQDWRHLYNAVQNNGAKLISINSSYNMASAKADMFLPVKPGSDAVLAMAMCNVLIDEDLLDIEFLKKSTVAPFLVKESDGKFLRLSDLGMLPEGAKDAPVVMAADGTVGLPADIADPVIEGSFEVEGMAVTAALDLLKERLAEWTPERAAEICELDVDDIRMVARIIGTEKPVAVQAGYGIDRYMNGAQAYFAIGALMMLSGNVGRVGTHFTCYYPLGSHYTKRFAYQVPSKPQAQVKAPTSMFTDVVLNEEYAGKPIKITSLFSSYSNMLGSYPDRARKIEAFNKLEFIVTCDMVMSDTAQYSDIVLPVPHWFEQEDLILSGLPLPYTVLQEKAVDPLGECKTDFEICTLLGRAMGFEDDFTMNEEDVFNYLLNHDAARAMDITLTSLREKKAIRCLEEDTYIHGEGGVFPTATGRAQFYLETLKGNFDYGQEIDIDKLRMASWDPPAEVWDDSPNRDKYPLHCVQSHTRWRTHGQFNRVEWLRELDPEPMARINPADAEARGIRNNDVVEVFNDRGSAVVKARLSNGMRPGMVDIPHGWQGDQYIEGSYNNLTSSAVHPLYATGIFADCAVDVRLWEGAN
ncbi:MAG: molybdopterin-dependent oxidoreductase [Eggerthellaceae bacterium]|nr:molybdopterin-dependent oxidoreductase [Eggerthellaceae bacterium]